MTESRRIEVECRLYCDHCHAAPFILYRRQLRKGDGSLSEAFENVVWPNGAGLAPPPEPDRCPHCGGALRRVAG